MLVIGCGSDDGADIETVQRLSDSFATAWIENDPERIASIFTEDGTSVDTLGREHVGSDRIEQHVEQWGYLVTESRRTGPIEEREDGTFVFPIEMVFDSRALVGEIAVSLEDEFFARHDWIDGPTQIQDDD
jgi:hypothetical protein